MRAASMPTKCIVQIATAREKAAPASSTRRRMPTASPTLHRQGEPDIGALNGHHNGEQNEPRLVCELHTAPLPVRDDGCNLCQV